jgi:Fungal specific transcription factor domain
MDPSLLEELDSILDHYKDETFAIHAYPPALFAEIIKINYLRLRASRNAHTDADNFTKEAYGILNRINNFSPDQWARSKPASKNDWLLIGNAYQAAVVLYSISSLQSVSVLPPSSFLIESCTTNARRLHILLSNGLLSFKTNTYMLWPLIVLGVEAVNGGPELRAFVRNQLPELSCRIGVYLPLVAKGLLEKFWASGETHWDACFDRPYGFATQLAVDSSKLRYQSSPSISTV